MLNDSISRFVTVTSLLVLAMATGGCASDNIRSDYDPTADFSQYSTFNFFEELKERMGGD